MKKKRDLEKQLKHIADPVFRFMVLHRSLIAAVIFAFTVAFVIMYSTLSYNENGIEVSANIWGDFVNHIPLVRSFSYGDNIPPESPLYSSERIKYHFLFDFMVGMLEKVGFRFDLAMNILSIVGFTGLLIIVYLLAKRIFKANAAGWIAMLLMLFNSSFSWIYYISEKGLGLKSLSEISQNNKYAAFGPYDDKVISAFWTLNVYTNQRHLAFSFAFMFFTLWAIAYSKRKWANIAGVVALMLMPWLNKAMLLVLIVLLGLHFLGRPQSRIRIMVLSLFGGILAFPGLSFLSAQAAFGESGFRFYPGFLYNGTTWKDININDKSVRWLVYWLLNLGLLPIAAFSGWLSLGRLKLTKVKTLINRLNQIMLLLFSTERVWMLGAIVLFIIANNYVFAPDIATNHKFINFCIIIFNIYASGFLLKLFKKFFPVAMLLLTSLILGGIFDAFPVFNVPRHTWQDIGNSKATTWVINNTTPDSRFLNLGYDATPAVTAGRRTYYGSEYLNWSVGYKTLERRAILQPITEGKLKKEEVCKFLYEEDLKYIINNGYENDFVDVKINKDYFKENFVSVADNETIFPFTIWSRDASCK